MQHFSTENWIDFARGMPAAEAAGIQSHLGQNCDECRQSLEIWQAICALFARETGYRPPEDAVETAKAAYNSGKRWVWFAQFAEAARLVFDSFQQPAPAMVRGFRGSARQLVHEAEPFVIDLRLESDPMRNRISLLGQILNSRNPEIELHAVDVVLLSGEDVVFKTSANASGEFDMEFRPDEDLRLFINIRGQRAIGIVLPNVES